MRLKLTDIDLEELEQLVDQARREPLSEESQRKLRAMVETIKTMTQRLESDNLTIEQARAMLCDDADDDDQGLLSIRRACEQ